MTSEIFRRAAALFFLVAVAVVYIRLSKTPFQGQPQQYTLAANAVMKNVAVPMRDGTILRADVWLPPREGRFPALVYRTPYGKEKAPEEWTTFAKLPARGYAVVIEGVR